MNTGLFPLITTEFVAKDDSIIRFELFNRDVADVEDRNSPMSPGMGQWYAWYHANWRVPAEEPIVIEWASDKKDTIIGSTCTVTLVSPYDCALQTLYTTNPRLWCCLISRKAVGGNDYSDVWFGWLDPEFYEEPFTAKKDYEVTLTFCDFGVLKRLKVFPPFNQLQGRFTMNMMINCALAQIDATCGDYDYNQPPRYTQYTSTERTDGTKVIGGGLQVQIANFTDEDGEVMTWYDALEAILRPLALRIEQRAGRYYLYDINKLVEVDASQPVPYYRASVRFWLANQTFTTVFVGLYLSRELALSNAQLWIDQNRSTVGFVRTETYITETTQTGACNVFWSGTDQTLSVDETFNHIKVTFSPYAEAVLFDPEKEVQFETDCDWMPVKNGYDYSSQERYNSFQLSTISAGNTAETFGGVTVEPNTTLFKIKSLEGGNDCEGVIAFLADYNHDDTDFPELNERYYHLDYDGDVLYAGFRRPSQIQQAIASDGMTGQALYRTRRIMIPNAYGKSALAWTKAMLKIQIPMLYDQRYNPWEQVDTDHNAMRAGGLGIKGRANSIGLRLNIRLYKQQTGGSPIRYYQNIAWVDLSVNDEVVTMQSQITADCTLTAAGWLPVISGQSQVLPTLIMYNKFDGSKVDAEDSPCLGGMTDGGMPFNNNCDTDHYFRKNNDGLYVPFPSIDTDSNDYQSYYWLEVEVTDGLYIYDQGHMQRGSAEHYYELPNIYLKNPVSSSDFGLAPYGDCRWWLVGFPTIKIVCNNNKVYEDVEQDDVESSGVINANAAEELSIDTICGSHDSPFANGAYIVNGNPVTTLRRGIRTASIEQLLIGTIYSQYAGRHIKLSGTAKAVLPLQGVYMLKDSHYGSKRFLVTSEVYNVIEGESEITMVEASPDNYSSE